jgi:hypothetical protein
MADTNFQTMFFLQAELASVHSKEEENFVTANIRDSTEYSTSAIYWLGGQLVAKSIDHWEWVDGSPLTFTGNVFPFCSCKNPLPQYTSTPLYRNTFHRTNTLHLC